MRNILLGLMALMLWGCEKSANRDPRSVARFVVVPDANGGVWRLDSQSGDLVHCTAGLDYELHCVVGSPAGTLPKPN